jgi:uncharacterized protein (TIGR00730 family)
MPVQPLRVCVYCASSEQVDRRYRVVAEELGTAIAAAGWQLVYGGGAIGLMGDVARAALAGGAHVTGIIPHRLARREIALDEVSELIRTDTMRERKALMDAYSDAFVVLPGGIGTLEELVEIVTLKQLGFHDRAVVIIDAEGYWDPLLEQLRRMVDQRMADRRVLTLWEVARDVREAMGALHSYQPTMQAPPTAVELEAVEAPPQGGS